MRPARSLARAVVPVLQEATPMTEPDLVNNICRDCDRPLHACFCDEPDVSDYDDDDGELCFHCGGEGEEECDDYLECTSHHRTMTHPETGQFFQFCVCGSCGGSGLAKDMTIW